MLVLHFVPGVMHTFVWIIGLLLFVASSSKKECYQATCKELSGPQLDSRVKEAKKKKDASIIRSNIRQREKIVECPICRREVTPATFGHLKTHVGRKRCKDENDHEAINMIKSRSYQHGGTTLDVSYCLSTCNDADHASEELKRCVNIKLDKLDKTIKTTNPKRRKVTK